MRTLEQRRILDAARAIKSAERKVAKANRPKPIKPDAPGQREPRTRDPAYLAWLHHDIPCIACLIEGPPPSDTRFPIEVAHQKHTDLKGPALGKRPSDSASCPLCSWHHRIAPDACDPAQTKFWARLGVDVGSFCKALYGAFKAGEPGHPIVLQFAHQRRSA